MPNLIKMKMELALGEKKLAIQRLEYRLLELDAEKMRIADSIEKSVKDVEELEEKLKEIDG